MECYETEEEQGKFSADSDASYLQVGSDHATVSGVSRDSSQQANTLPCHTAAKGGVTDTQNCHVPSQTAWNRGLSSDVGNQHHNPMEVSREAIMPSMNTPRNTPSISSPVSRLLAQYEEK